MVKTCRQHFGFSAQIDTRSDSVVGLPILSFLVYKTKDSDELIELQRDFFTLHFCTLQYLESFGASGPSKSSKVSMFSLLPFGTPGLHAEAA